MSGFFVTGTDTNVGKTVLSALLVAALDGAYWKPVQTGSIEGTDRESVRRWTGLPEDRFFPEQYCFDPPVSPHLAARLAGARISLETLHIPETLSGLPLIVEGAGGVFAQVNDRELMTDLMRHVGLPVVVATRTTLGTINHTLMTLAALRAARLTVRGVVMIGDEHLENRAAIEHYGNVHVLGRIPVLRTLDRAAFLDAFGKHFDREAFL
ncbi:MAG: dethiobiotin synthase [Candidatus Acidiferrales bacterium]